MSAPLVTTSIAATHPWPLLVDNPRRYCRRCETHVASETGGIPTLCPICGDDDRRARR